MPSKEPVSLVARERLRDYQAAAAKAVGAHGIAMVRLDTAVRRRAEVLAGQDALIAAANAEVTAAVVRVAQIMGVDVAASLLELTKAEVRRMAKAEEGGTN